MHSPFIFSRFPKKTPKNDIILGRVHLKASDEKDLKLTFCLKGFARWSFGWKKRRIKEKKEIKAWKKNGEILKSMHCNGRWVAVGVHKGKKLLENVLRVFLLKIWMTQYKENIELIIYVDCISRWKTECS